MAHRDHQLQQRVGVGFVADLGEQLRSILSWWMGNERSEASDA
jgi:hypothetical protein